MKRRMRPMATFYCAPRTVEWAACWRVHDLVGGPNLGAFIVEYP